MFALVVDRELSGRSDPTHVAGIFARFADALAFARRMEVGADCSARLVELAASVFPFLLIQDEDFFSASDEQAVRYIVDAAEHRPRLGPDAREGDIHFNVFRIHEEFRPADAGADLMGGLDHVHVVDETLDAVRDGAGFDMGWTHFLGASSTRRRGSPRLRGGRQSTGHR